jgi:hypothetical protein
LLGAMAAMSKKWGKPMENPWKNDIGKLGKDPSIYIYI